MEARQVSGKLDGDSASGPQGFEDAIAELEAAVVDGEVRDVGGKQPAIQPDVRCDGRCHACSVTAEG